VKFVSSISHAMLGLGASQIIYNTTAIASSVLIVRSTSC